ncbi:MAG TPA: hypothetical protein PLP34_09475, partial [Chitinophagaceae bacterium]|nr:hypothetical protein [Chitinophagaceae bacterium]
SSLSAYPSKSKKSKKSFDRTRILIGPGLGFGAGYRSFSFNISPSVAYAINENFHVGTTLGFNYFQASEDYTNPVTAQQAVFKYKYPAYSLSVFARYLLKDYLIFNVEPELNNTKVVTGYYFDKQGKILENKQRLFVPSFLVGAGYPQRFGRYSYSYFLVCYDLIQDPNARYYQTLDFRAGIMLNLWN